MAEIHDKRALIKALRAAGATPIQVRMAAILLAVNGLENALGFIQMVVANRLADQPHQPQLLPDEATL